MRLKGNTSITLFVLLLIQLKTGFAQDSISSIKRIHEYIPEKITSTASSFSTFDISKIVSDSTIKDKLSRAFSFPDTSIKSKLFPALPIRKTVFSSKPLFQVGNGYIGYNWSYRSGKDSSFIEDNVSQNLLSGSFTATIAQTLPLRVTYLERRTNSKLFKDFRYISVDVDVQRYRQLSLQKALANFRNAAENRGDQLLPYAIQSVSQKLNQYNDLLNDSKFIRELIHAKEVLIRKDFADTSAYYRDSIKGRAREFIRVYDTIQVQKNKYEHLKDSLQTVYNDAENTRKKIERLLSSNSLSESEVEELVVHYGKENKSIRKLMQVYSGIRKLSVGRTLPDFSDLTLKNVNVNGLNIEYSKGAFYFAAAAGVVDFRIRDFLQSEQSIPKQYVYSARIGYFTKQKSNIILTYLRGEKQLFGGNLQRGTTDIQGISVGVEFFILRNIRLFGEIAQSGVPYVTGGDLSAKPTFRLNDNSQRAYSTRVRSFFPRSETLIEGHYQHSGLNYQSFNNFQNNAIANSWAIRLEQSFWKRQVTLQGVLRKNDFINPLVLQRYNANTIFKNLLVTFRKRNWPVMSMGYMPSSQYTAVGAQIYENHYQTFTGNISHQYRIGIIKAGTLVSFSRFFNDSPDSGFVYYNSRNFFINQTFLFRLFTATINISGMNNSQNNLIVMEEGISSNLFKNINVGIGVKINHLNQTITKVGFNAKAKFALKKIGEINLWLEQSYLPNNQGGLFRYEMYNIGFARYLF